MRIKKIISSLICLMLFVSTFNITSPISVSAKIKLDNAKLEIGIAETKYINIDDTNGDVSWSNTNNSVCEITENQSTTYVVIRGKKKGTSTVTATYKNKKYNCKVTVKQKHIKYRKIYLTKGEIYNIKSPSSYFKNTKITYASSNDEKIAKASTAGNIKGYNTGSTMLWFSAGSKYENPYFNNNVYNVDVVIVPKTTIKPKFTTTHYSISSKDEFSEISLDGKKYSKKIEYLKPEHEYKIYYRNVKTITKKATTPKTTTIKTKSKIYRTKLEKGRYIDYNNSFNDSNYGTIDKVYYYKNYDEFGALVVGNQKLTINIFDLKNKYISSKDIKLPYPIFGGFYHATDGNFYVAVGQRIKEGTDGKKVCYAILKYDENWNLLDRATINGDTARTTVPFDAGTSSMVMIGNNLVFYAARERYVSSDGLNHQSNYTAVIDTTDMNVIYNATDFPFNHVSHSFQSFVKADGESAIFVDHGDAYPRSIVIQKVDDFINFLSQDDFYITTKSLDVLPIIGHTGDNYTGSYVTGVEIGLNNNLVVGSSVPHNNAVDGVVGNSSDFAKNIYLSVVDKNLDSEKFIWLTKNSPNGELKVTKPRIVKIDEDKFAVMFSTYKNIDYKVELQDLIVVMVDSNGDILSKKTYQPNFTSSSQPIYFNGKISWYEHDPLSESINGDLDMILSIDVD